MASNTTNYNLIKPAVNDPTDQNLWGGYLNTNFDTIDTQLKTNADAIALGGVPTGVSFDFTGTSAPAGYLLCYGQNVSRTTYANLFAVIGTTYGIGDGSTTFTLPDSRGRVSAGKDNMGGTSASRLTGITGGVDGNVLGATGGAESHVLTVAQMPAHDHDIYNAAGGGGAYAATVASPADNGQTPYPTESVGSGEAHNNTQPTIIFNKIIKT